MTGPRCCLVRKSNQQADKLVQHWRCDVQPFLFQLFRFFAANKKQFTRFFHNFTSHFWRTTLHFASFCDFNSIAKSSIFNVEVCDNALEKFTGRAEVVRYFLNFAREKICKKLSESKWCSLFPFGRSTFRQGRSLSKPPWSCLTFTRLSICIAFNFYSRTK